jgi:hypothetical protein
MTKSPDANPADRDLDPEDEVLEVGQEEVFSRTEVELGRIEHASEAGSKKRPQTPA